MSVLAAIGAAVAGAAAQAGGSLLGTAYSAHEARRNASVANKEGWHYYKKQKELDYQYDRNQYFDLDKLYAEYEYELSKRYAENSAKWQVQGLRNAGLNPILAATDGNFRGTFGNGVERTGHGGQSIGGHSPSTPTSDLGLAKGATSALETYANLNTAKANVENTEKNTALQEEQLKTEKTQQLLNQANAERSLVDAANSAQNEGDNSYRSQIMHSAKDTIGDITHTIHDMKEDFMKPFRGPDINSAERFKGKDGKYYYRLQPVNLPKFL